MSLIRRQVKRFDDGFLGKADPNLIRATIAEIEDELAVRAGVKTRAEIEPPEPRPLTHAEWPHRDYTMVQRWRHRKLAEIAADPTLVDKWYSKDPLKFICQWIDVIEPRNAGKAQTRLPFLLFLRQAELITFFHACVMDEGPAIVEKSRDMGATWCGIGYSIWMWRFVPEAALGWGSANAEKLDRLGDPNSIFEKIRLAIMSLHQPFKPKGLTSKDLMFKRILNPENGSTITGDVGDNIGRGGRTRVYFVDEAAYLEHPDAVEGALSENTRVRIDISSVSRPGTVFHRTRQAGVEWAPGRPILRDRANVFLMDRRDHPEKTDAWAAERKAFFESKGLGHVYAREIDRDYSAVTEGAIIRPEWVDAVYDAHKKIKFISEDAWTGRKVAGLDVGEETGAASACTVVDGQLVRGLKSWSVRDTAISARHAVNLCKSYTPIELNYDSIGIGAGIKAETNRLAEENLLPQGLVLVPWHAGDNVLNPHHRIIPNDPKSLTNHQFFLNLRAQAWWHLRTLCWNTYRAVKDGIVSPVELMIAIDCSTIEIGLLHKLRDELTQVQSTTNTAKMRLSIVKAPDGFQSPNLADSLVIAKFPMPAARSGTGGLFGPMVITG